MRKMTFVVAFLVVFALSGLGAAGRSGLTGFGVFGSFGSSTLGATGGGLGLTAKFGSFPVIGLQYDLAGDSRLALSCDYYLVDAQGLTGALSYFLGLGAFGGLSLGSGTTADFGLRLPLGLQLWPVRGLEAYVSAVPLVRLIPTATLGLGGELGLRLHF